MHFLKTKLFWGTLGIFLLVFLLTPVHAFAWWPFAIGGGVLIIDYLLGSPLVNAAAQPFLDALSGFINVLLGTIAFLLQGIYIALGKMLFGLIKYFIQVPVAPDPTTTPFVYEAWNFSRNFVNGLFLLILVFIGLATILRIQSYQLQRTLPLLIIVALLVNFSGVLVGVVVDIGNILTASFLNPTEHFTWEWNPWIGTAPEQTTEKMGQNIARIFFFLFGIFIYFVITFVFAFRIIVLWTISILAPLAFVSAILPVSRGWWRQWLSALVQWSFIGVPIAFFMFLAGNAMNVDYEGAGGIDNAITAVFAPASAFLLLLIGVGISLSLAPAWGRRVALLGAGVGVAAGVGAAYLGVRRYGGGTQQFFENLRQRGQGVPIRDEDKTKLERGLERIGSLPGFKQVGGALAGWGKQRLTTTSDEESTTDYYGFPIKNKGTEKSESRQGLAKGVFGLGGKLVAGTAGALEGSTSRLVTLANKSAEEQLRRAMAEAQRLRPADNALRIRESLIRPTRESSMTALAHYLKMVLDNDPGDIQRLVETGALSQSHLKKIGTAAKQLKNPNHYRTFLKSQINRINDFEPGWGEDDINGFIHRFVRPEDISNVNIDWHQYVPDNPNDPNDEKGKTFDRLILQSGRNLVPNMLQAIGDPAARERLMDRLESHDDDWYINNRKESVLLWSTSNAALDQFGLSPLRGYTRNQAQRIVRERRLKNRPEASLRQEVDNLRIELEVPASENQRRPIRRQIERIENELRLRDKDINPDAKLAQEAETYENEIGRLTNQINTTPENQRNSDWHAERARNQVALRDIQEEQNRRQREEPSGPEAVRGIRVPPITEPVGEQIANREARLREIDEVLARPGPVANRSALEKENTKLNKELIQLRSRRDQLPPDLLQKEQELETLQREYLTKQRLAEDTKKKIEQEQALGTTEAEIATMRENVRQAERELDALSKQREAARQERKQAIMTDRGWRNPERKHAEKIAALQAHEWELTRQLRQQEATAAPPDAIRKTEGLLNRTLRERETSERKLAAMLRSRQLANALNKANEQQQKLTSQIEEARNRLQTATGEPAQLLQNRINSLEKQLQKATQRTGKLTDEENRLERMEGDWKTLGITAEEKATWEEKLQNNVYDHEFERIEKKIAEATTGLADENPEDLTEEQRKDRATYLKNIERVRQSRGISSEIERLVGQHRDVEGQIHREGRRREQGI